jgi:hypothetical protein
MKGRVAITTADIVRIKGCSLRAAQRELQKIRFLLNRPKGAPIFVCDYCQYNNIEEKKLKLFLEI